jgi:hypothetical protein
MAFVRDHLILFVIGGFIAITVLQVLFRARAFFNGNDPEKMQLLAGREEVSDSEFHSNYYPGTQQTLVTTARYLFANRARVPHDLLLPTDRLADFGIQDLGDMVMGGVRKAQQEKQLPSLPVEKLDTLDDMIKLEVWMLANRSTTIQRQ